MKKSPRWHFQLPQLSRSCSELLLFSLRVVFDSFETPWTVGTRFLCPWDFPGENNRSGFAISFSRESSQPRDQTHVSCIAGGFFTLSHQGCLLWMVSPNLFRVLYSIPQGGKHSTCLSKKRTAFYWVTFHQSAPQSLNILCLVAFLMSCSSDFSLHEKGEFKASLFYCWPFLVLFNLWEVWG